MMSGLHFGHKYLISKDSSQQILDLGQPSPLLTNLHIICIIPIIQPAEVLHLPPTTSTHKAKIPFKVSFYIFLKVELSRPEGPRKQFRQFLGYFLLTSFKAMQPTVIQWLLANEQAFSFLNNNAKKTALFSIKLLKFSFN